MEVTRWERLRRLPEARAAFQRVLLRFPEDTDAMVGLGYVELSDKNATQADVLFARAIAVDPDDVSAIEGMGHVRFRQGRFADARVHFTRALELNPGNSETREMLDRIERFEPSGAPAKAEAS